MTQTDRAAAADSKSESVAAFYEQLALLVRSRVPLPEGLAQLAKSVSSRRFGAVLREVAADTAQARPLSAALARQPAWFQPLHAQLLAICEERESLADLLGELAHATRMQANLVARARAAAAYPAAVFFIGFAVYLLITVAVLPEFVEGLRYFSDVGGMSAASAHTIQVITGVQSCARELAIAGALVFCLVFWAMNAPHAAPSLHRALMQLPGAGMIRRLANHSLAAHLWGVQHRAGVPLPDLLAQTAAVLDDSPLSRQLQRWADAHSRGKALPELAATAPPAVDHLLVLTLRHTPEPGLAQALLELGDVYESRCQLYCDRLVSRWNMAVTAGYCLALAVCIILMFQPLVHLTLQMLR
jgi:type IV pilus assembly protein PilC